MNITLRTLMDGNSSDPVDLELLYFVPVLALAEEYRNLEEFAAGVQVTQSILGVGS